MAFGSSTEVLLKSWHLLAFICNGVQVLEPTTFSADDPFQALCSSRVANESSNALFTWWEEDSSEIFLRLVTCRNFGWAGHQVEKKKKKICRPLAAKRPAAAMFVFVSLELGPSERR